MMRAALAALLLVAAAAAAASANGAPPPVKISQQAVAGLSAGAFMTVQYHLAYSSELVGAGVIAGGPFYCAGDSETTALTACMSAPELLNLDKCVSAAQDCAKGNVCDSLSNLSKQRVWLYSGSKDTVVNQGVMVALEKFYQKFMPASQVNTTFGIPSEHSWVTSDFGSSCGTLGSPYINNCGFDSSLNMMESIMGRGLAAPAAANQSAFYAIDQSKYTPSGASPASISLGPTAYAYVPAACAAGTECTLVTVLHGCQQTIDDIGNKFIQHVGMNEVAEANNMVLLYPQAIKSEFAPMNPEGCFDWWGYTGSNYANQKGPQMSTIHGMVEAIIAGSAQ